VNLPDPIPIPPGFQGFDSRGALRIYERYLPHWRQEGAFYFVTFRLVDSIPQLVANQLAEEARIWRDRILREEQQHDGHLPDRLAEEWHEFQRRYMCKLESIMDNGLGSCVLRDTTVRKVVADALMFFDRNRYNLQGFVVMPNHAHLCVQPRHGWELETLLRSWKGFTSRELNKRLARRGTLWQQDNYNRIVRDAQHFVRVIRYIANNPAKANLREDEFTVWFPFQCEATSESVERTSKSVHATGTQHGLQDGEAVVREDTPRYGDADDDHW